MGIREFLNRNAHSLGALGLTLFFATMALSLKVGGQYGNNALILTSVAFGCLGIVLLTRGANARQRRVITISLVTFTVFSTLLTLWSMTHPHYIDAGRQAAYALKGAAISLGFAAIAMAVLWNLTNLTGRLLLGVGVLLAPLPSIWEWRQWETGLADIGANDPGASPLKLSLDIGMLLLLAFGCLAVTAECYIRRRRDVHAVPPPPTPN